MTAITLSPPWHYDLLLISPSAMTRCTDNCTTCCWQQPLQPPGYSLSQPTWAGRPIYGPPELLLHACHPLDTSTTLSRVHMPYNVTVATRHSWQLCCTTHLPPPLPSPDRDAPGVRRANSLSMTCAFMHLRSTGINLTSSLPSPSTRCSSEFLLVQDQLLATHTCLNSCVLLARQVKVRTALAPFPCPHLKCVQSC